MRTHLPHAENVQFQIAPMVDIIFILILFFMASAGTLKVENELSIALPGTVQQTATVNMVDEQLVQIMENGQVLLNQKEYDRPTDKHMSQLLTTLQRFKTMSESTKSPVLVTVVSAPNTKYERVIDVLDACAAVGIKSVTFTAEGDEQQ